MTECEKKFLISPPPESFLKAAEKIRITQSYLAPPEGFDTARVRFSSCGDKAEYTHTLKRFVSGFTRVEEEARITPSEYEALLKNRISVIEKTRYVLPHGGHVLEIDVYPFMREAVLEIELSREDESYIIPDWINVIKDVSSDPEYTNARLAEKFGSVK